MSAEELREVLSKKPENEELKKLRLRVAELETENTALKHELEHAKSAKRDIDAAEREFLKFLGIRVIKL